MKPKLRRILHRLFFAALALATLIALFYAEENWRGERAWQAAKRDIEARGESLDIHKLIPPPVPDDQNLAMAPLFARVFEYDTDPKTGEHSFSHGTSYYTNETYQQLQAMPWGKTMVTVPQPSGFGNWESGHPINLGILQRYYRKRPDFPHADHEQTPAEDVLLALSRWQGIFDELAQASAERPQSRFPIAYLHRPAWGIQLPHYSPLRELTGVLRLRAVAELATGQTPAARRDILQCLHLRRATGSEPVLIATLVDITCLGITMQPIWEGLAARQWSADDLDALSNGLREINFLQEYQRGMRGERAFFWSHFADDMRADAGELAKTLPRMSGREGDYTAVDRALWGVLSAWPHGWYSQTAALSSRLVQEYWIDTVDPVARRMDVAKFNGAEQAIKNLPRLPTNYLAQESLLVFTSIAKKFVQSQATVDQAVIACALEKYYLEHHAYPEALTALVPGYLDRVPNDIIDGAPMRYRLTVDGRYQLYSIAWNGKDEGGTIAWPPDRAWRKNGPADQKLPSPAKDGGDWVWQYAPAEPPDLPANESRLASAAPAAPK